MLNFSKDSCGVSSPLAHSHENYDNVFDTNTQSTEVLGTGSMLVLLILSFGWPVILVLIAIIIVTIVSIPGKLRSKKEIKEFLSQNKELVNKIKRELQFYKAQFINDLKNLLQTFDKLGLEIVDEYDPEITIGTLIKRIEKMVDDEFFKEILKQIKGDIAHKKDVNLLKDNYCIYEDYTNNNVTVRPKTGWKPTDFNDDDKVMNEKNGYIRTLKNEVIIKYDKLIKNEMAKTFVKNKYNIMTDIECLSLEDMFPNGGDEMFYLENESDQGILVNFDMIFCISQFK